MTTLRWTEPASADFLGIVDWIKTANSNAVATEVGWRILNAAERLADLPYLGKLGRSSDTRELPIAGLPYLIVYGVEPVMAPSDGPARIVILRVLHGSMLWPRPGAADRDG